MTGCVALVYEREDLGQGEFGAGAGEEVVALEALIETPVHEKAVSSDGAGAVAGLVQPFGEGDPAVREGRVCRVHSVDLRRDAGEQRGHGRQGPRRRGPGHVVHDAVRGKGVDVGRGIERAVAGQGVGAQGVHHDEDHPGHDVPVGGVRACHSIADRAAEVDTTGARQRSAHQDPLGDADGALQRCGARRVPLAQGAKPGVGDGGAHGQRGAQEDRSARGQEGRPVGEVRDHGGCARGSCDDPRVHAPSQDLERHPPQHGDQARGEHGLAGDGEQGQVQGLETRWSRGQVDPRVGQGERRGSGEEGADHRAVRARLGVRSAHSASKGSSSSFCAVSSDPLKSAPTSTASR